MTIKKKKTPCKKSVKRRVVKKKTVSRSRKKVAKKRVVKKARKKNPAGEGYYVAFITSGKKNDKFYYHGINYKTRGLKFSTGPNSPVVFTTRKAAIASVHDMIKIFVPEQQKKLFPVGADLIHPKR